MMNNFRIVGRCARALQRFSVQRYASEGPKQSTQQRDVCAPKWPEPKACEAPKVEEEACDQPKAEVVCDPPEAEAKAASEVCDQPKAEVVSDPPEVEAKAATEVSDQPKAEVVCDAPKAEAETMKAASKTSPPPPPPEKGNPCGADAGKSGKADMSKKPPTSSLAQKPVNVSPVIRFFRWSFLIVGVFYGFFRRRRLCKKEEQLREEMAHHQVEIDRRLAEEKRIRAANEAKALALLSAPVSAHK